MARLFANSGEPDQTPQNAASDLVVHCLPTSFLGVSRLKWVNTQTLPEEGGGVRVPVFLFP